MHMPQLTDAHRKLSRLAGRWRAEETMHPSPWDPQGGTSVGRTETRAVLDGWFVESRYEQERGGHVTYKGLGVFGFDAQRQKYVMNWYDTMGGCGSTPAFGTWEGDRLVLEHTPMPGMSVRYTYAFEGDDRLRFKLENSPDGGRTWVPFIESVAVREG